MNANAEFEKNNWSTIIIGAGQAGLSTGYYLKKFDEDFIIIDASKKIGDSWRKRWDSLRLFTPSQYDGLPGLKFSQKRNIFPVKNEMADYLENYSKRFSLPVRLGIHVIRVSYTPTGFEIDSTSGKLMSKRLVIATGTNPVPRIPDFAKDINIGIKQIHSSQYLNSGQFPPGDTLVVGAGTSGVEIAIELSESHNTMIAGKPTFHIPEPVLKYGGGLYWWFINNILTVRTPIGKKAKTKVLKGGGPLIRISADALDIAGVERLPRVTGVSNGLPRLEDGRVLEVKNIVWSTGFKPDFSWIDLNVTNGTGWPLTDRGLSLKAEGLYFVGMPFQYGLSSGLIGGVGRDALYVAKHIKESFQNN